MLGIVCCPLQNAKDYKYIGTNKRGSRTGRALKDLPVIRDDPMKMCNRHYLSLATLGEGKSKSYTASSSESMAWQNLLQYINSPIPTIILRSTRKPDILTVTLYLDICGYG
ncbi:hypothetical protein J6590_070672 [Homalodisca vitripennis]|nr:hypothetical protein J6590_070672 [Homalodisca vitripennis]